MAEYTPKLFNPMIQKTGQFDGSAFNGLLGLSGSNSPIPLGTESLSKLFKELGISDWATPDSYSTNEAGQQMLATGGTINDAARKALEGVSFDWNKGGYGASGNLTGYRPDGTQFQVQQQDTPMSKSALEAAALAAAGFGGVGLMGLGPLSGLGSLLGTAGTAGGVDAGIAAGLDAAGSAFTPEALSAWGQGSLGGAIDFGAGSSALAGAGDAGGFGLADEIAMGMDAAGSGFTPEAMSAWGGSAGVGVPASAGGAGSGIAAGMDAAGSAFTPDALSAWGRSAGVGVPGASSGFSLPTSLGGWANTLAPLASTGAQIFGANSARNAMQDATNSSNALLRSMYDQTRADNLPALTARNDAIGQIQALLKDPSTITKDPGYQFQRDQGLKAAQNSAAAKGMLGSGSTLKGLTQYGNDYASTKLNDSINRMLQVANVGNGAAATIAGSGNSSAQAQANNLTDMGNASGAYNIALGNALGNGINQLTAYGNQNNWWGKG